MFFNQGNSSARSIWVRLLRLTRGSGRRKFFIAVWFAILIIVTILVFRYQSYRSFNFMKSSLRKRLIHYCNPPGPVLGNEDLVPMEYTQFKLKQVQVIARHGDRASVATNFRAAVSSHFNCKLKSKNSQELAKIQIVKNMEKFFKIFRLRKDGEHITEDFSLHENAVCKAGQLTPTGYLQHVYLGEHIFYAYGKRLEMTLAMAEEEQMLVYATPITRTQESAAGFLSGMLQSVYQNTESTDDMPQMKIHVSPDRLGIFRDDENGEVPPCPRLHEVIEGNKESRKFRSGLAAIEPLMQKFSHLFNLSRSKLPPVTKLADLIITHHCHRHSPVCGANGCVDNTIKAESLKAAEWAFVSNYTPPAILLSHPVLSKIFQRMKLKVSGEEHKKFVLYSTHDSTVIPVLINFGIWTNEWVPYTSRIVFELWEAGGLLGTKLKGDEFDRHFVRVLYDGQDFTTKIRMCKHALKFGKLCSLKSFVSALEGGADSMDVKYVSLCQAKV